MRVTFPAKTPQGEDTELWWEANFEIPKGAVAVNFVVNCENAWDNNGGKDHKVRQAASQCPMDRGCMSFAGGTTCLQLQRCTVC